MIKFLRHLVVDDFLLKLFSLALALLFWLTVSFAIQQREGSVRPPLALTAEVRTFFNLPVLVMSSAADVRHFKVSPNQIEVTVQGDPRLLQKLQSKDIHVTVDLTGIESAQSLRKRIEVSTPAGVTHVAVLPPEVQVLIPSTPPVR
jgi:YbbR domain-containing protein